MVRVFTLMQLKSDWYSLYAPSKSVKYDKKYHVFMRDMCDVEKIVKELWMFAWHLYDVNDRLWDNCWSLMSSKEEVVEKPW